MLKYIKEHHTLLPYKDSEKARAASRRSQIKGYYKMKQILDNGQKKECVCGCGRLINLKTPNGRPVNFCKGHRKLTPEESEHRRNILKRLSSRPEFQRRRFLGQYIKPNKVERRLINIIDKYQLPFKYVGDGFHIIEKSCPDFLVIDGSKLIIEIFGDYWHTMLGRTLMSSEEGRVKRFEELGYKTLVIWESEMKHLSDDNIYRKIISWICEKEVIQ